MNSHHEESETRITRTRRVHEFQEDGTRVTEDRAFAGDELIKILEAENRSYVELLELKNREIAKLRERLRG